MAQIIDEADATEAIAALKQNGNFVVLLTGCFEVLHAGHLAFFKAARDYKHHGQRTVVVVGVESDQTLRLSRANKARPIFGQAERVQTVSNVAGIDLAITFSPNIALDYADTLAFTMRLKRLAPDAMAISYNDSLPYFKELMHVQTHECAEAGVLILPVMHHVHTHATDAVDLLVQKSFIDRTSYPERWQSKASKS